MIQQLKFNNVFFFLTLISLVSTDMKAQNVINTDYLRQLGKNYLKFMSDAANGAITPSDPRITTLFAENLTKTDNRTVLFENSRQSLLAQIAEFTEQRKLDADKKIATIDIEHATFIPSSETNSVVVYFEWSHMSIGRATTMVILQCNPAGQIERVIDVWAKIA